MSTSNDIVDAALRKIRVHSEINEAEQSSFDYCFDELKSMLGEFRDEGIDIGCRNPEVLQSELGEPEGVRNAVINLLARRVVDYFQVDIPNAVGTGALRGYEHLIRYYKPVKCEDRKLLPTLPKGQGNSGIIQSSYFKDGQRVGHYIPGSEYD